MNNSWLAVVKGSDVFVYTEASKLVLYLLCRPVKWATS